MRLSEEILAGSTLIICLTDQQPYRFGEAISNRYFEVVSGSMTLEQLCDWVRSVEPAEEARCAEPADTCTDAVRKGVA